MRRLLIAGTGVGRRLAGVVYGAMARDIDAEIVVLPRFGLDHVEDTVLDFYERFRASDLEIVGHSQGGVVAAHLAVTTRVKRVVTLGAPLCGTRLAPVWAPFSSARCMSWDSRYVRRLNRALARQVGRKEIHNIVSTGDRLVDEGSGLIPGAHHVVLKGIRHAELAWHPEARRAVVEALA